jgi:hypothetical protein
MHKIIKDILWYTAESGSIMRLVQIGIANFEMADANGVSQKK